MTARLDAREQRQIGWSVALLLLVLLAPPLLLLRDGSTFPGPEHLSELAICAAFAAVAYLCRGVTLSGAVAGLAISYAVYVGAGLAGFATLVTLFVLTWCCTRIGRRRKRLLGVRDDTRGRTAAQVVSNLGVAGLCALAALAAPAPELLILAMVAALAEAAADTVSSEIGEATGRDARLITTLQRVPAGTDGGVTLAGSCAGILAALLVARVGSWQPLFDSWAFLLAWLCGLLGVVCDSFLGATLEHRRILANNGVNFLSTAFAGAAGWLAGHFLLHW